MAENRLFALNSDGRQRQLELTETCAHAFCALIQGYIDDRIRQDKVNPTRSEGINRAKALIHHINVELVQRRKFTGQQLLWIMFDYATRDRGCWPLETSSMLRESILNYLCRYLGVDEDQIAHCGRLREADKLSEHALPVTPPGLFNPRNVREPYDYATEYLIKVKLAAITQPEIPDINFGYSHQLLTSLDKYIAWAEKKWFKGEGISRAKNIKTLIATEWLPYEKLNETQLMWRILEQIELEREDSYGIFCSSTDCRLIVMRDLCEYLGLAAEVKAQVKKEVNRHYTERVGFFYLDRIEDDLQKEMRVTVHVIKNALLQRNTPSNQNSNLVKSM